MDTTQAMQHLKTAMQGDLEYAWAWHCNIAMAAFDEGLDPTRANLAAARFMRLAFDVDTEPLFREMQAKA